MPSKLDPDARTGDKLLRLFRKLLFDNRRHFQQDLPWPRQDPRRC